MYGLFYLVAVLLRKRKYDGEINVSKTDIKTIYGLTLNVPPEELAYRDEIIFLVIRRDDPESQG